jgi:antitoxin VapB
MSPSNVWILPSHWCMVMRVARRGLCRFRAAILNKRPPDVVTLKLFFGWYILDIYHGGDLVERAKIFQSGRSQAVRLPKEFRFNGSEVFVKRIGKAVVLLPTDDAWDSLAQSLDLFSDDFMDERNQSQEQQREEPF